MRTRAAWEEGFEAVRSLTQVLAGHGIDARE